MAQRIKPLRLEDPMTPTTLPYRSRQPLSVCMREPTPIVSTRRQAMHDPLPLNLSCPPIQSNKLIYNRPGAVGSFANAGQSPDSGISTPTVPRSLARWGSE